MKVDFTFWRASPNQAHAGTSDLSASDSTSTSSLSSSSTYYSASSSSFKSDAGSISSSHKQKKSTGKFFQKLFSGKRPTLPDPRRSPPAPVSSFERLVPTYNVDKPLSIPPGQNAGSVGSSDLFHANEQPSGVPPQGYGLGSVLRNGSEKEGQQAVVDSSQSPESGQASPATRRKNETFNENAELRANFLAADRWLHLNPDPVVSEKRSSMPDSSDSGNDTETAIESDSSRGQASGDSRRSRESGQLDRIESAESKFRNHNDNDDVVESFLTGEKSLPVSPGAGAEDHLTSSRTNSRVGTDVNLGPVISVPLQEDTGSHRTAEQPLEKVKTPEPDPIQPSDPFAHFYAYCRDRELPATPPNNFSHGIQSAHPTVQSPKIPKPTETPPPPTVLDRAVIEPVTKMLDEKNLGNLIRSISEGLKPALPANPTKLQVEKHRKLTDLLDNLAEPADMSTERKKLLLSAQKDARALAKAVKGKGAAGISDDYNRFAMELEPTLGPRKYGSYLEVVSARIEHMEKELEAGVPPECRHEFNQLLYSLENIKFSGNMNLKHRDTFAKAATYSKELAASMKSSRKTEADSHLPDAYAELGAFFKELKRHHLTAAAPAIMRDYVRRYRRQCQMVAKGLDDSLAGASMVKIKECELGVAAVAGTVAAEGSVAITAGAGVYERIFIDDDGDTNIIIAKDGSIGIKVNGEIIGLNGMLGGKGTWFKGNFIETSSFSAAIPILTNMRANSRTTIASASPGVRKFRKLKRKFGSALGNMKYIGPINEPLYLGSKKLAKGSYNTAAIHRYGLSALNALNPDNNVGELLQAAYPHVRETLHAREELVAKHGALLGRAGMGISGNLMTMTNGTSNPAVRTLPKSNDCDAYAFSLQKFQIDGAFGYSGDPTGGAGPIRPGFKLSGSLIDLTIQSLPLERLKLSHKFLANDYLDDMGEIFNLYRFIEEPGRVEKDGKSAAARLHLFNQINGKLEQNANARRRTGVLPPPRQLQSLGKKEREYYEHPSKANQNSGIFGTTIPRQFQETICDPSIERLKNLENLSKDLYKQYASFVHHAAILSETVDKSTPATMADQVNRERMESFNFINQHVWGGQASDQCDAVMKNPKYFIGESLDGFSLALAAIGTHISIIKRELSRPDSPARKLDAGTKKSIEKQVEAADTSFLITEGTISSYHLPVAEDPLLRCTTIFAKGKVKRRTLGLGNMTLKGSALGSFIASVPSLENSDIASNFGGLKLRVGVSKPKTERHPNVVREGDYLEIRLEVEAGVPGMGPLVTAVIERAIEKYYRGTKATSEQVAEQVGMVLRDLKRHAAGATSIFEVTDGATFVMRFRKPLVNEEKDANENITTEDTVNKVDKSTEPEKSKDDEKSEGGEKKIELKKSIAVEEGKGLEKIEETVNITATDKSDEIEESDELAESGEIAEIDEDDEKLESDEINWKLQYVRVLQKSTTGFETNFKWVYKKLTSVGCVFQPRARVAVTESIHSPTFEVMGTDLSYQIIQLPQLVKGTKFDAEMNASVRESMEPIDWKEIFKAKPYLVNKYFGNPETVISFIDAYLDHKSDVAAQKVRYDNPTSFMLVDGDFKKNRGNEHKVFRNAAGVKNDKDGRAIDFWGSPSNPLKAIWNHPYGPAGGAAPHERLPGPLERREEWEEMKLKLRTLSLEERMAYLLDDRELEGSVFDWYAKMCYSCFMANEDGKKAVGYKPEVRRSRADIKARKKIAADETAAEAALASAVLPDVAKPEGRKAGGIEGKIRGLFSRRR